MDVLGDKVEEPEGRATIICVCYTAVTKGVHGGFEFKSWVVLVY